MRWGDEGVATHVPKKVSVVACGGSGRRRGREKWCKVPNQAEKSRQVRVVRVVVGCGGRITIIVDLTQWFHLHHCEILV